MKIKYANADSGVYLSEHGLRSRAMCKAAMLVAKSIPMSQGHHEDRTPWMQYLSNPWWDGQEPVFKFFENHGFRLEVRYCEYQLVAI